MSGSELLAAETFREQAGEFEQEQVWSYERDFARLPLVEQVEGGGAAGLRQDPLCGDAAIDDESFGHELAAAVLADEREAGIESRERIGEAVDLFSEGAEIAAALKFLRLLLKGVNDLRIKAAALVLGFPLDGEVDGFRDLFDGYVHGTILEPGTRDCNYVLTSTLHCEVLCFRETA